MRLSWNEVRARAAQFVNEWKDATDGNSRNAQFLQCVLQDFWGSPPSNGDPLDDVAGDASPPPVVDLGGAGMGVPGPFDVGCEPLVEIMAHGDLQAFPPFSANSSERWFPWSRRSWIRSRMMAPTRAPV